MKKYICLNHGECNWADEIPPREFSLDDADINCPNCGSANIREAVPPPGIDWKKTGIVAGCVLLLLAVIWAFTSKPPLVISARTSCKSNSVTVSTMEGNGEPIVLYSPELGKRQVDSVFRIPESKRSGATLTFWAVQGSDSVKTSLVTNCEKPRGPIPTGGGGHGGPQPPEQPETGIPNSVVWSRIESSKFCVDDCVVEYTEQDNLGHTRIRRIENYADCCPANN